VPQEQPQLINNHQLPQLLHIRVLKPRNVSPSPLQSLLVPFHSLKSILPQPLILTDSPPPFLHQPWNLTNMPPLQQKHLGLLQSLNLTDYVLSGPNLLRTQMLCPLHLLI
jgi:hypothetical protein